MFRSFIQTSFYVMLTFSHEFKLDITPFMKIYKGKKKKKTQRQNKHGRQMNHRQNLASTMKE